MQGDIMPYERRTLLESCDRSFVQALDHLLEVREDKGEDEDEDEESEPAHHLLYVQFPLKRDRYLPAMARKVQDQKMLSRSKSRIPFARVLVLGERGSGRTSLCGALRNGRPIQEDFGDNPPIQVSDWFPESKSNDDCQPLHIKLWDFASHRTYYATHQANFSPLALYVVVTKICVDNEEIRKKSFDAATRWVLSIGTQVPQGAKVLLVGSYWNRRHHQDKEIFDNLLENFYEMLRTEDACRVEPTKDCDYADKISPIDFQGYVGVDCTPGSDHGHNIAAVQNKIVEIVRTMMNVDYGDIPIDRVLKVKADLQMEDKPVVWVQDFLSRMKEQGSYNFKRKKKLREIEKTREDALNLAHQLGELQYNPNIMPGIVITDPQLPIELYYNLFYPKEVYIKKVGKAFKYIDSMLSTQRTLNSQLYSEGILIESMLPRLWHFKEDALKGFDEYQLRRIFFSALPALDIIIRVGDDNESSERVEFLVPGILVNRRRMAQRAISSGSCIDQLQMKLPVQGKHFVICRRITISGIIPKNFSGRFITRSLEILKHHNGQRISSKDFDVGVTQMGCVFEGWPARPGSNAFLIQHPRNDQIEIFLAVTPSESDAQSATTPPSGDIPPALTQEAVQKTSLLMNDINYELEELLSQNRRYITVDQLGANCKCSKTGLDHSCVYGLDVYWTGNRESIEAISIEDPNLSEIYRQLFSDFEKGRHNREHTRAGDHPNFGGDRFPQPRTTSHPEYLVYVDSNTTPEERKKLTETMKSFCSMDRSNEGQRSCMGRRSLAVRSGGAENQRDSPFGIRNHDDLPPNIRARVQLNTIYRGHPIVDRYYQLDDYQFEVLYDGISRIQFLNAHSVEVSIEGSEAAVRSFEGRASSSAVSVTAGCLGAGSKKWRTEIIKKFSTDPIRPKEKEYPITDIDEKILLSMGTKLRRVVQSRRDKGGEKLGRESFSIEYEVENSRNIKLAVDAMQSGLGGTFSREKRESVRVSFKVKYFIWKNGQWVLEDLPLSRRTSSPASLRP